MSVGKEKIKICSINVWGLLDATKRKKIFLWLDSNNFDITFLQETHCTVDDIAKIERDCSGVMYHSVTVTKIRRGVSIVISNKFAHTVVKSHTDNEGRRIMLNIEHDGTDISLINMYAPNKQKDRKLFFSRCEKWIRNTSKTGSNIILGGDTNCCLNDNDRTPVTHLNDKSRKTFRKLVEVLDLKDCWDEDQEDRYTWSNSDSSIKSRIDYLFVNKDFVYQKEKVETKIMITSEIGKRLSDHKAVIATFYKDSRGRGPGYWKLNTEHLKSDDYIQGVNQVINDVIQECKQNKLNNRITWDILKLKVKEYSIKYSKIKAYEKKDRIRFLEKNLKHLSYAKNGDREGQKKIENELDILYTNKAKGAQIRARAQWVEEGERNTKYFTQLERSRQNTSVIKCLQVGNENVMEDGKILELLGIFITSYTKVVRWKMIK